MMTMAAHQLGPSGAATAMDAAAYQRAAAAAWYIDPATRAAGYTTNAAADWNMNNEEQHEKEH